MASLSIIVLAYNHQDFIGENLDGIFMQEISGNVELIICNDASTDGTHALITKKISAAPKNFTVKYFNHSENLGATPNFYFALEQITGEYIAFCEGDDYWTDPQKLETQLKFLALNPEYSLCFHQVMNVSPHAAYNQKIFATVEDRDYSAPEIYRHWTVHTASVVMRRSVLDSDAFQKTLKNPTLLYFDTILFLAASTMGKIRGMSRTMSAYRRHEQGISFRQNLKKDLAHNDLDTIIADYHGGKIKNLANWQIFMRSKLGFETALKQRKYTVAYNFLVWILKKHKILIIYLIKKWQP